MPYTGHCSPPPSPLPSPSLPPSPCAFFGTRTVAVLFVPGTPPTSLCQSTACASSCHCHLTSGVSRVGCVSVGFVCRHAFSLSRLFLKECDCSTPGASQRGMHRHAASRSARDQQSRLDSCCRHHPSSPTSPPQSPARASSCHAHLNWGVSRAG